MDRVLHRRSVDEVKLQAQGLPLWLQVQGFPLWRLLGVRALLIIHRIVPHTVGVVLHLLGLLNVLILQARS